MNGIGAALDKNCTAVLILDFASRCFIMSFLVGVRLDFSIKGENEPWDSLRDACC